MAKGTHNKTHKRNQSIIRKILDEKINNPRINATHERLLKCTYGQGDNSLITKKKIHFDIQMILMLNILKQKNLLLLIDVK